MPATKLRQHLVQAGSAIQTSHVHKLKGVVKRKEAALLIHRLSIKLKRRSGDKN